MSNQISTYGKVSKTLMKACSQPKYAGIITEIGNEDNTGDGWWIYLAPGWWSSASECGMIHEYTVADCLKQLSTIEKDRRPADQR